MAEKNTIQRLAPLREMVRSRLESSRAVSSTLHDADRRLDEMKQRLSPLVAEKCSMFCSIHDRFDHVLGLSTWLLKINDNIKELEWHLLLSSHSSDVYGYLSVVKKLEEFVRFVTASVKLVGQWLEDAVHFLQTNDVENPIFITTSKRCLMIIEQLQSYHPTVLVNGGLLSDAISRLEPKIFSFLAENQSNDERKINMLRAITRNLNGENLMVFMNRYVEIRARCVRNSFQDFGLAYLEKRINESDEVEILESDIDQWSKNLDMAVKKVLVFEKKLCDHGFDCVGKLMRNRCFADIATHSGFLEFIEFGKKITVCKNNPNKLLKLVEIFKRLESLREDFVRLFRGESCDAIRNQTKELINRVITVGFELFWNLPEAVEQLMACSPPMDGSVPQVVTVLVSFFNCLLSDPYKPQLKRIIKIQYTWKKKKFSEGLILNKIVSVVMKLSSNLNHWKNSYKDISLSFFFMMNSHCHFSNLKGTMLGNLMGDLWLYKHEHFKERYLELYLQESWGRIIVLLKKQDQIRCSPTRFSGRYYMKKRLALINQELNCLYTRQMNWTVSDIDLSTRLSNFLIQFLIPAYRNFMQINGFKEDGDSNVVNIETMLGALY